MNVLKLFATAVPPFAVALAKKLGAVASVWFNYTGYYIKGETLMLHHGQKTLKKAPNFY